MTTKHVARALWLTVGLLVMSTPAVAQGEPKADLKLSVVNTNGVFVLAGAADSYYPFGKLRRGDVVQVIGAKQDWIRVATAGPAFRGFFGYVRFTRSDSAMLRLAEDGQSGKALGRVRVLAPNMNTGYEPADSWKRILTLAPNQMVDVLETIVTDRHIVHKIMLPANAEGWISSAFLGPASAEQIAEWEPAPNIPAVAQALPTVPIDIAPPVEGDPNAPVLGRQEETVAAVEPLADTATEEATVPAPPKRTAEALLEDLEAAYDRLRKEPITSAEVLPMRKLYLALAADHHENDPVARYAKARAEQLTIWAELQERRAKLDVLRKRIDLTADEAAAMRLALESKGLYIAVGRLTTSIVYSGAQFPRLFRIQDPRTSRTLGYLRPDGGFDLYGMLDQLIGVVGSRTPDQTLQLNVFEPHRIDLLSAR